MTRNNTFEVGNLGTYVVKKVCLFKGSGCIPKTLRSTDNIGVNESGLYNCVVSEKKAEKIGSSVTEALELIKEDKANEAAKDTYVVNRFFLGPTLATLNINDKIDINDYKNRNLYDYVQIKKFWRGLATHVIKIHENKLILYSSKSIKIPATDVKEEYFPCQDNSNSYYPIEKTTSLNTSVLYVIKKNDGFKLCPFFCTCDSSKNLEKIINVEIRKVFKENDSYILEVVKDGNSKNIPMSNLDFVIFSDGSYNIFRCSGPMNFMKWLTVIQLRQKMDFNIN